MQLGRPQFAVEGVDEVPDNGRARVVGAAATAGLSRFHDGDGLQHAPATVVLRSASFRFDKLTGGATDLVPGGARRALRSEPQEMLERLEEREGQGGLYLSMCGVETSDYSTLD